MPLVNDIPQLDGIYILNDTKVLTEELMKKWQKIKSVHTNIDDLCQALQIGIKQLNQDSIAMSFITADDMKSPNNLNRLEPTFMYTQIFKDILLDMQHNEQAIKHFTAYCRHHDCGSAKNIDEFEKKYQSQSAIWWYTWPSFIYSMLNYALRSMEGDTIIKMGFFIHDLHQQIQKLHQQQLSSYQDIPFIVYRGQGLSKANFEKLQKTKGGLISFNNFLSTTMKQHIALGLACNASEMQDMVGIFFVMSVDPNVKSAPFASIKKESYFKEEEEILFSMHTVFRVIAIKPMDNKNQLYQVELQLTSDDDEQLRLLTDQIREEAGGNTAAQRLGKLLLIVGQCNKAEEFYNLLLEETSDESEKALYYASLGYIKNDKGDYEKAIWYYEHALQMQQKTPASNPSDVATAYNGIASAYENMGEYLIALSYYEKTLEIYETTFSLNHPYLPGLYNNIGGVYDKMGKDSKALLFLEKALKIWQIALPLNHPNLAASYNNIGCVYDRMEEYSKALSSHEKAFEIRERTLPSNHPDMAISYNDFGSVYNHMGQYSKALSFYEKALEIRQKTTHSNHPSLAISYNNIGRVYSNMKDYSKALSYYERALDILKRALPPTHPHIKITKENIEIVKNKL
ncbi:unnamed protein product [Adineta steineri]|uniref:NAD(P)(+)--arginine ADP-ribosyltransferase n=1 Tax=Adineta steineri TaxID=433720 RepID=A0A813Y710_9BILA|nr:unnamed protein product [Adineta steineri]CAF3655877.1 unnamed protein product [Adineta steineri]